MTSRAKAERRKAHAISRRAIEQSFKLLSEMTEEQQEAMVAKYGADIAPHELVKRFTRAMLANEVREKIKADGILNREAAGLDPMSEAEVLESINEDTVVEMLEQMVEGDDVIDDAATHQWFRDKLAAHRDAEIEADNKAEEMEAFSTVIGLAMAFHNYDVLFDTTASGEPGDVGVIANPAARHLFEGVELQWTDTYNPEHHEWKQACFKVTGPDGPPPDPVKFIAEITAKNTPLRVGVVKRYGNVDPVSAEAA